MLAILTVWIGIVVPPYINAEQDKGTVMRIGIVLVIWFVELTTV